MHQIVPQKVDAKERAVIAVTEFSAGSAKNIIPDRSLLGGSVRTFSQEVRELIAKEIETQVKHFTAVHGADYKFEYNYGYSSVVNDKQLTSLIENIIRESLGPEYILHIDPIMGGEDFSAFLTKIPGVFIGVGAAFEDESLNYPHHHPKFGIQEDSLEVGLKILVHTALKLNS